MAAVFGAIIGFERERRGRSKPDAEGPLRCAAIAARSKGCYEPGMDKTFGECASKGFVLQDRKRLPGRFFARLFGTLSRRAA